MGIVDVFGVENTLSGGLEGDGFAHGEVTDIHIRTFDFRSESDIFDGLFVREYQLL